MEEGRGPGDKLMRQAHQVQRVVVIILMLLMLLVVAFSTLELAMLLFVELIDPRENVFFIEIEELLEIFSFFFLVLIGIELLETIQLYISENTVHAEIVILVAIIAVARKVIVLDLKAYDPVAILGLAAVIAALGATYFLMDNLSIGAEYRRTAAYISSADA